MEYEKRRKSLVLFPNCKNNKNQHKEDWYFKFLFLVTGWCNELIYFYYQIETKVRSIMQCSVCKVHTVQEWLEIKFYCLWLFSTFHIHTWWGQSKYVRKFEISRANFEKTQNLYILKNFLWILCINIQNRSNSKKLRLKSFRNLPKISKLVEEPLN